VQPKPRVGYWAFMLSTFSLCVQSGNAAQSVQSDQMSLQIQIMARPIAMPVRQADRAIEGYCPVSVNNPI
jgi:hypothetical protein